MKLFENLFFQLVGCIVKIGIGNNNFVNFIGLLLFFIGHSAETKEEKYFDLVNV